MVRPVAGSNPAGRFALPSPPPALTPEEVARLVHKFEDWYPAYRNFIRRYVQHAPDHTS